jgi:hypothetical protein
MSSNTRRADVCSERAPVTLGQFGERADLVRGISW